MQAHADLAPQRRFGALRNRPLMTLMLGHFTVDMYVGILPVLYPLLIQRFALTLTTVGLVTLAYSGMASLTQPFFGWVADRFGTRFIGLALSWTALTFATIGFAPSFPVLLLLAAAAGVGSGAYHPLGALTANRVIPDGQRNAAMAVYSSGGTMGVALGPLAGVALFGLFGLRGTALMVLPGVGIAAWMLREMRGSTAGRPRRTGHAGRAGAPVPLAPLLAAIGVVMSRTCTIYVIESFVPTWYKQLGYGPSFYGPLATTVVLGSAAGTLGCGSLADRYGRRTVVLASLALSVPALALFTTVTGPSAFFSAALVGLLAASTTPLMLVTAQQLMAGRAGMASGLILGLGFVTGAVGVPVTGALGDAFGIENALRLQVLLVIATLGLAWRLPTEAQLSELATD